MECRKGWYKEEPKIESLGILGLLIYGKIYIGSIIRMYCGELWLIGLGLCACGQKAIGLNPNLNRIVMSPLGP